MAAPVFLSVPRSGSRTGSRLSLPWIAAILLAGALGVYFRLYPMTVFPHDLALNNAKFILLSQVRKAAGKQVDERAAAGAPLSATERARHIDAIVSTTMRKEPAQIARLLDERARALERGEREASRGGYLLEVDPYYYLTQTERVLATGRISDQTRGREYWNPMTLAPTGYWYPMDLHPHLGAAAVRAVRLFAPRVDIVPVVRWVPLGLALAALAVFAWFCRNVIGAAGWPGAMGLIYLALCPMFLKRSLVGWYDTDPYNVLFPLAAIAGIFIAFGSPEATTRRRWAGAGLAAAAFSLHALFWRGWTIPFIVILLFVSAGILLPRTLRPAGLGRRTCAAMTTLIAAAPFLALAAVWGPLAVRQEALATADFVMGFLKPGFRAWPDVFITVGELKPMTFGQVTRLLGGSAWTLLILVGVTVSLVRRIRSSAPGERAFILPLITLIGSVCLGLAVSVRVQRFAILVAAPLAACVPFAWAEWRRMFERCLPFIFAPGPADTIRRRSGAVWAAATLAAVLLLSARAHAEIVRFYPLYNPAWDRMMAQVREKTPEDAIITSWWSPGHFLTSMGRRRVTLDGSSQNEPQAYWTANLFIEPSERTALGILRMLNASGNASVDHLTARGLTLSESVELIKSLIPLSRTDARARLLRRFKAAEADALLDLTHGTGTLPPSYLFVYNHMIEQALALEFVGRWDFKKAEAFRSRLEQQPGEVDRRSLSRATPQNTGLLWAMSEKPTFYENEGYEVGRDGDRILFSNGVRYDPATNAAEIVGNPRLKGRPASVFRIDGKEELVETPMSDPQLTVSVLIIDDSSAPTGRSAYRSVIMGRRMAASIAVRLYYFGGRGLHFVHKVASEDSAAHRTRLGLFEVDWTGF